MSALDTSVWAVAYCGLGWPVFPVWGLRRSGDRWVCRCPHGPACTSSGKHPHALTRRGFHDASIDATVVASWWDRDRSANIGLTCGPAFDVLDIDTADLEAGVAELPHCETDGGPVVRTGSGKWHLYFAPTGIARRIGIVPAVDWLGSGGYVIAPPSRHVAGGHYEWLSDCTLPLHAPPQPLLDLLDPPVRYSVPANPASSLAPPAPRRGRWSPDGLIGRMARAIEGERNDVLLWCAARIGTDLTRGRVDENTAMAALEQLGDVAYDRGLDRSEIERTIRSGLDRP